MTTQEVKRKFNTIFVALVNKSKTQVRGQGGFMRVTILTYLIVLILLSSCASPQIKGKISSQEDQLQSVPAQTFIIPAILMDGKNVGDLVLGQTTLEQALQIMPPWPGYPPKPLPLEEFEKANPGLLERLEKAGEVLKRVKKSYNPMNALYILFFDKNEKLVIVQRDFTFKKEREETRKMYEQYQHQMKEVYRDKERDKEVVRMQGEIQPCITLEVISDIKELKTDGPFRTGHIFTCPTKQQQFESKDAAFYNNRGISYGKKGQFDLAILDYDRALDINPRLTEAYYNRGNAYGKRGQYDQAISDFTKALDINPKLADAYYNRGIAYFEKRQYDQAISDYNKALQINPKYADAYINRGRAYGRKGEHDQTISDCNKALEINPRLAEAYNNRGFAHYNKGQYDQAILDYNKALEIDPKYVLSYGNRGLAYETKGQYDQAISDYNKTLEIEPRAAEAYYRRGYVYYLQKEYNKSWEDVKKAQALGYKIPPEFLDDLQKASGRQKFSVEVTGIDITEYGIYKAEVLKSEASPSVAATYQTLGSVTLIEQTDKIPAKLGTRFGFRYTINGYPNGEKVDITLKMISPVIKRPNDNREFSLQEVVLENETIGVNTYSDYVFEEPWEMVPGEWRLQLFHNGKKLAEKTFYIYKP